MARSTVHYADNETNNILKRLHNKLRPAGTPVQRVEYIIELLLIRIFEVKVKHDLTFKPLRKLFEKENYRLLFSHLLSLNGDEIKSELNKNFFPFYSTILTKSKEVFVGNLPQKIQDQLVLIEEVFANSGFTTNVQSGNMSEVISLISEIDEDRILKTDLLGDAIESALSETGGTKDIGLYRTPEHIRQLMVTLVDPNFNDIIFDPACGTGGFLFDAYQYVLEKVTKDGKWPNSKTPEYIKQFFKKYFSKFSDSMPSVDTVNAFYRHGIAGIEYSGMIRKMAAINLYIRGLNPANIEQGDSLKKYDPSIDVGSKTAVLANPPFGAERDQPAYPNIWEEYSKESETTILFVKLMFNLLQKNGRCAVVVSEGFLTWGQNSARAMRKLLLEEANLKAIISVPQGVFVSKSGQGAKTSILYFEKGTPTNFVWYYKIENDGFSMGTNRKEISGSQIPEVIELFQKVKLGKKPPETKNSFCVSKEQIETLDPRIANRIKKEVSEKTKKKNTKKRLKLLESLDKRLKNKKISKEMYEEKLWQFDNIVEGQIDNEVAKAIEKAHNYHFNLQNYRSSLSSEQIKDWQETLKGVEVKNGSKIEKHYLELQKSDPKTASQILASFDPRDALQMDIAREYLSKLDKKALEKNEKLAKLFELLKETKLFPFKSLGALLVQKENKIKLQDDVLYKQITIKLYGKGVLVRQEVVGSEIKTEAQFIVNAGDFIMSKIDARNGAFGIVPEILEGAVVTTSFPYFEIQTDKANPQYLESIVTQKSFYDQINNMVSGATGRRSVEVDNFLELQIPLPPLEVQNEIVEKIEKQKQIIEGAKKIEENIIIDFDFDIYSKEQLKTVTKEITKGTTPTSIGGEYLSSGILFVRSENVLVNKLDTRSSLFISESLHKKELKRSYIKKGDVLLNIVGASIGRSCVYNLDFEANCNQAVSILRPKEDRILPKYLSYWFNASSAQTQMFKEKYGGARDNLNLGQIGEFEIPLPPLEVQNEIVGKLDRQMQALEGVRLLKSEAEKRIEEILAKVWGEK